MKKMMAAMALLLLATLANPHCALAQTPAAGEADEMTEAEKRSIEAATKLNESLTILTDTVNLVEDKVALNLTGTGFRAILGHQADLYTQMLGNPPDPSIIAVVLSPEKDTTTSWFTVFYYDEEGHIKDDDANDIDYDDLLEDMKEDDEETNKAREKEGYPGIYDLNWAMSMRFGEDTAKVLNYKIIALGRKGKLTALTVAGVYELEAIKPAMMAMLNRIEYKEGSRYSDFDPDIDAVAAVGIGSLIAGKALAKVGFFAVLLKFGKFIIIGIVAFFGLVWGRIKNMFGSKTTVINVPRTTPPPDADTQTADTAPADSTASADTGPETPDDPADTPANDGTQPPAES